MSSWLHLNVWFCVLKERKLHEEENSSGSADSASADTSEPNSLADQVGLLACFFFFWVTLGDLIISILKLKCHVV